MSNDNRFEEASSTNPQFTHPSVVRSDERFELRIDGLPRGIPVIISASMDDDKGNTWQTSARYRTNDGSLELDRTPPIDGPFESADTMSLIQAMEPVDEVDIPYQIPEEATLEVRVSADGTILGTSSLTRTIADPGVKSLPTPDHLVGELYVPAGDEPAPGVLLLHGGDGRPLDEQARLLASHGFAALALKYFNFIGQWDNPSLPTGLVEIPVEYADEAVEWLLDHDRVQGSSVGLYGFSKGSELGLQVASHNSNIGAVVSLNGSALTWQGIVEGGDNPGPTWTHDGEPVPYIEWADDIDWELEEPIEFRQKYTASYEAASVKEIEAATTPVERIEGPVVFITGGDDQMWNTGRFNQHAIDRLEAYDRPYEHLYFEEAGHTILPPYRPVANREVGYWLFGGSPEAYASADEPYWQRTIETLSTIDTEQ
ncbi:acyl-CoA thioesterase/bile acid-CoA:amino acid N-acyltransferase family protein [Natrinema salsiterrestre]|uniref:Acyl-CoA thioesterase/BAAT N-terminal domain-containing protein n=1 Tax=Natrinema salsiterrestre TaxID=2950540 RepID=A0A9Q4Q4R8_9EURY|nr:acyl-CoA thioesterase/bile acid-CoA:amino acid N-acyltransferase family protein [Natrinema salsiterrestre]MDF9747483.1 acyl-CoA thioesterase/BAAT N-terminal domain-containing protein [Natrinema salsiterrestre]